MAVPVGSLDGTNSRLSVSAITHNDPSKGIGVPYTTSDRTLRYVSPNTVARDVLYALGKHNVLGDFSSGPRSLKRKRASSHESHIMASVAGESLRDNMLLPSGRSEKVTPPSDRDPLKTQPSISTIPVTRITPHTMDSTPTTTQADGTDGKVDQPDHPVNISNPTGTQAPPSSGAEGVFPKDVTGGYVQKIPASPATAVVSLSRATLTHSSPVSAATKAAFLSWKSSLEENKGVYEDVEQPNHIHGEYSPSNSEVTSKGNSLVPRNMSQPPTLPTNKSLLSRPPNPNIEVLPITTLESALSRTVQRPNLPRPESTQQLVSSNVSCCYFRQRGDAHVWLR